jgi:hypothetical protein
MMEGINLDLKDGEVEGEEKVPVKVSTSGPRMSRRESYRADKKFMIRLPRSKFLSALTIWLELNNKLRYRN